MDSIPAITLPLLHQFSAAFTLPTWRHAQVLLFSALLTTGRHTIANLVRTAGALARAHPSTYQRVLSQARWSSLCLAAILTRSVLHVLPAGPVFLVGDDTVTEHRGKKVYGKARHRDAVRSSHSYTAHRYGHKWVVLAILVRFPFARRPWALPILVALYRSPQDKQKKQEKQEKQRYARPHRTPGQLLRRLVRLLRRWHPQRHFVLAADGGFGSHAMARFAARQQGRLTLVSRFYADANLYAPPPPRVGKINGRPRIKGAKLPSPAQVVAVARTRRTRAGAPRLLRVAWYGGGQRDVQVVTGLGHWYKVGAGLVAVRWVHVHDRTGTHRDEYFYSTDTTLSAKEIIEAYTGRWNIETTFQEAREYMGLGSTRGWCRQTVLRAEPCLLGLYTLVALLYASLPTHLTEDWQVVWLGKETMTFSDAITVVRRWLWQEWVFARDDHRQAFAKLPPPLKETLLCALAPPA